MRFSAWPPLPKILIFELDFRQIGGTEHQRCAWWRTLLGPAARHVRRRAAENTASAVRHVDGRRAPQLTVCPVLKAREQPPSLAHDVWPVFCPFDSTARRTEVFTPRADATQKHGEL